MKIILEPEQFSRTLKRITHEIIERNDNLNDVVLVGILSKGLPIAKYIASMISTLEGVEVPVESIDIKKHRDDDKRDISIDLDLKTNINNKTVILVDDVLYTGRSVRAAMDALMDFGRPSKIKLAILVDRGHRELPIRADFVGKNVPTSHSEKVFVDFANKTVSIL